MARAKQHNSVESGTANRSNDFITVHTHSDFRNTVVVPNQTAQNAALSWAARGLLLFMLSMPASWRFREADLIGRSPMGRDHLRSIVRELEAHHYLRRSPVFDRAHRKTGSLWEIWDVPQGPSQKTVAKPPTENPSVEPQTENPSVDKPLATTGIFPPTENPSVVPEPLTGFPPTENPSVYKRNIQEKPHNPLSPSLRSGDRPPGGSVRFDSQASDRIQQLEQHPATSPALNATPEAARSPGKALVPAPAATDTTRGAEGPLQARKTRTKAAASLPAFAEPVRDHLEAWWRLRRKRHRAAADDALSIRSINALHYANDQGVLHQFAELAAESGWLSLGFNGHREFINKLVSDLAVDPASRRSESCTLRSRSGLTATSRQSAAADRAIAMFTTVDAEPRPVASCSPLLTSLTSLPA